jgi:NADH-quinone oxidoreductase subunit N
MSIAAIETPPVQLAQIAQLLILLGSACLLLIVTSFNKGPGERRFAATWSLLAFAGAGVAAALLFPEHDRLVMAGQVREDHYTALFCVIICAAGFLTVAASWGTHRLDEHISEYFALLMTSAAGMCLLVSSNGFVTLFVALELLSIALYVLCALDIDSVASLEAGLKYLIIGSVGSAFLLFGSGLVYGGTGSLRFDTIGASLQKANAHEPMILLGVGMVIVGLAFKASAAPFHMWTPDVYEGAPTAITAFMATATKAAALAVLFRVVVVAFHPSSDVWEIAVAALAIVSMLVGNIAALVQTNAKRMLAYSSIGHAGYLLIPVVANTPFAARALIYYLVVYAAMNLGAFAVITFRERELRAPVTLNDLTGWGYERPVLGAALALFLLSLASFPPTGGFLAKLYLFRAAIDSGDTYLAIIGVIATMISLGYYLRYLLALYQRPEGAPAAIRHRVPGALTAGFTVAVSAGIVLWLGIAPAPLLDWAREAATSLYAAVTLR